MIISPTFSMRELVARVKATLRRPAMEMVEEQLLSCNGVEIDLARHSVRIDGRSAVLSPKEFDLLSLLLRNRGRVMGRDEILSLVWGDEGQYRDSHTVDVHIRWLREKLEANPAKPERLLTIRGIGYKFAE